MAEAEEMTPVEYAIAGIKVSCLTSIFFKG